MLPEGATTKVKPSLTSQTLPRPGLDPAPWAPLCSQLFFRSHWHLDAQETENQTALVFLQAWRPPASSGCVPCSDCASPTLEQCPAASHNLTPPGGGRCGVSTVKLPKSCPSERLEPCDEADMGPINPTTFQWYLFSR